MVDDISGAEPTGAGRTTREPLTFGRIVIIGGGCYGSWYAQQLQRAEAAGALHSREIVVVDRDPECRVAQRMAEGAYPALALRLETSTWDEYLIAWLGQGAPALVNDAMVPSPLMPHLCLDWLMARARQRWPGRQLTVESLPAAPPMPWERAAPDGRHYVSFATWMCPVNCIEPERCPETRETRWWSMPPALESYVAGQRGVLDGSFIFHCTHRRYGVGMIDAHAIAAADDALAAAVDDSSRRFLVGTVSHCHGALGVLAIAAKPADAQVMAPAPTS